MTEKHTKKMPLAYKPLAMGMLVGIIITSCILFFVKSNKLVEIKSIEKTQTTPITYHEPRFEFYTELEGK